MSEANLKIIIQPHFCIFVKNFKIKKFEEIFYLIKFKNKNIKMGLDSQKI